MLRVSSRPRTEPLPIPREEARPHGARYGLPTARWSGRIVVILARISAGPPASLGSGVQPQPGGAAIQKAAPRCLSGRL
jgi:hypothetical protein